MASRSVRRSTLDQLVNPAFAVQLPENTLNKSVQVVRATHVKLRDLTRVET